jgi:2-polyprenyl-6-methoxyphenol hydroxylase-like FAD-dependent oxidoreductase
MAARSRTDVIIGADGIHSRVRPALFGPDDPRFTGKICYRSVIPIDAVAGERPATDNAQWRVAEVIRLRQPTRRCRRRYRGCLARSATASARPAAPATEAGVAQFEIVGTPANADPVYSGPTSSMPRRRTPYGYSMILPIRFTSP